MTIDDTKWLKISASLRKEVLYVKMCREKVVLLLQALIAADQDLLLKEVQESKRAFVFYGSTDDWKEDLVTLKAMEPNEVIEEFVAAVEAGLRNEAEVDWISRTGGPAREDGASLEDLTAVLDEEVISLD